MQTFRKIGTLISYRIVKDRFMRKILLTGIVYVTGMVSDEFHASLRNVISAFFESSSAENFAPGRRRTLKLEVSSVFSSLVRHGVSR